MFALNAGIDGEWKIMKVSIIIQSQWMIGFEILSECNFFSISFLAKRQVYNGSKYVHPLIS